MWICVNILLCALGPPCAAALPRVPQEGSACWTCCCEKLMYSVDLEVKLQLLLVQAVKNP